MQNAPEKVQTGDKKAPYHHGDLRAHLVETVRQLVEEKGADGFSISEAARRAGVSSAAPYKHFHDKVEIVREVALAGMRQLGAAMETASQINTDRPFGKIDALGKAYVDFARNEPGVFRIMFGLTAHHGDDCEIRETGQKTYGVLIREVAAALPPGTSEEDIRMRSYMLWTMVHGHSFLQIDGKVDTAAVKATEDVLLSELSNRVLGDRPQG